MLILMKLYECCSVKNYKTTPSPLLKKSNGGGILAPDLPLEMHRNYSGLVRCKADKEDIF